LSDEQHLRPTFVCYKDHETRFLEKEGFNQVRAVQARAADSSFQLR